MDIATPAKAQAINRVAPGPELCRPAPPYAVDPPISRTEGDIEAMAMYTGQGVGSIEAVEPAAAIAERFAAAL
jgi:nitronate monooxygenase